VEDVAEEEAQLQMAIQASISEEEGHDQAIQQAQMDVQGDYLS